MIGRSDRIEKLDTQIGRAVLYMDFWSDIDDSVTVNNVAADTALPDVTVSGLPAGATILRVVAMLMFRAVEDSSGGANQVNGAQMIEVRDDTPGTWTDAIDIVDNAFEVAANAKEGGTVIIGDRDIKSEVDADDTYNFQWDEAAVDAASMEFFDVQTGLRIYFTL